MYLHIYEVSQMNKNTIYHFLDVVLKPININWHASTILWLLLF